MAQQTHQAAAPKHPYADLAGYAFQNWDHETSPPVIINPEASLHAKLAWCWGEVCFIKSLGDVACQHNTDAMHGVGELLVAVSMPLEAMLRHLSEVTLNRQQGGVR